jgi:hypothetical protein
MAVNKKQKKGRGRKKIHSSSGFSGNIEWSGFLNSNSGELVREASISITATTAS